MNKRFYEYEYDPYLVVAAVITCLLGTYTTMNLIQNIRYSINIKTLIFMVVLSSFSLSILSVWSFHFLLLYSLKFKDVQIYLDLQLTFLSMLVAIILNAIGFCFSFLPFLKRTMKKFQEELDVQITSDKNKDKTLFSSKLQSIKDVDEKSKEKSVIQKSNYIKNLGGQIVKRAISSVIEINKQNEEEILKRNLDNCHYATFFEKEKLVRRDYLFILIGVLFIGPSTMLLHVVGMYALKIEGVVDFSSNLQIAITIIGVVACLVINFAFFYKDNSFIKVSMTFLITGALLTIHCTSVHVMSFFKYEGDESDYSYLENTSSILKLSIVSKIVVAVNAFFSYAFREVTVNLNRYSWKIINDVNIYMNLNIQNAFYIKKYVEEAYPKIRKEKLKQINKNDEKSEIRYESSDANLNINNVQIFPKNTSRFNN